MSSCVKETPISCVSEVAEQLNCSWQTNVHVSSEFDAAHYFMFYTGFILYDECGSAFVNKFARLDRTKFNIVRVNVVTQSCNNDDKTSCPELHVQTYFGWYEILTPYEESRLGSFCPCRNCISPTYLSMVYWFPVTFSSDCRKYSLDPNIETIHLCKLYLNKKNML